MLTTLINSLKKKFHSIANIFESRKQVIEEDIDQNRERYTQTLLKKGNTSYNCFHFVLYKINFI